MNEFNMIDLLAKLADKLAASWLLAGWLVGSLAGRLAGWLLAGWPKTLVPQLTNNKIRVTSEQ